jgi:hypothetical protein
VFLEIGVVAVARRRRMFSLHRFPPHFVSLRPGRPAAVMPADWGGNGGKNAAL